MRNELEELWRRREVLWILVRRDLKVRYKNSRLGFVWSIAPPLMQVAVITFVLTRATGVYAHFGSFSAYLLVAMIPWTYFNTALLDSSQSILNMYGVIKKVDLPRELIPLASAISNFIHFLMSWLVFFVYWWGIRRAPILPTSLLLPYLLFVQFMLVTGLSLLVSCLNVFYEDVKYILGIVLQMFFFALPIMYLVEQFQYSTGRGQWWHEAVVTAYRLNPLTALITAYRMILLQPPTDRETLADLKIDHMLPLDYGSLVTVGLFSFVILLGGYWYFNLRKWQFVERP